MVETGVRLAADLAKAAGGEIAGVLWKRDPHSQRQGNGAGRAGMALGLGEEPPRDAMAAEARMHGETAEVESLTLSGRQNAADEPVTGLRDDNTMIGEGGGDGFRGLAERARLGPEPAAVLLEGRADQLGDRRALRGRGEPNRDLARSGTQMPVCSGRWSSATKLLNFVVSPSKRSVTLSIGP